MSMGFLLPGWRCSLCQADSLTVNGCPPVSCGCQVDLNQDSDPRRRHADSGGYTWCMLGQLCRHVWILCMPSGLTTCPARGALLCVWVRQPTCSYDYLIGASHAYNYEAATYGRLLQCVASVSVAFWLRSIPAALCACTVLCICDMTTEGQKRAAVLRAALWHSVCAAT